MSILQRYVIKELLGPLGLGLLVFTFLFLIGQLFKLTDLLLNSGVPASLAGELVLSMLPGIFSITIPMAILLAILIGIGRLAADREILAIRTSGVNIAVVFLPVLIGATLIAGLMIWGNQAFVPYLNLKTADLRNQLVFEMLSAIPPDQAQSVDSGTGGPALTLFYESRDPETGEMNGIRVHTRLQKDDPELEEAEKETRSQMRHLQHATDETSRVELERLRSELERFAQRAEGEEALILARSGIMKANSEELMISMELTSGSINVVNSSDPASFRIIQFDGMTKNVFPNIGMDDEGTYKRKPNMLSVAELKESIQQERSNKKRNGLVTEFYWRHSVPLACIAFAFLGIPLAVYARPTGKAVAFAISFLLILVYYGLLQYGVGLGKAGSGMAVFAIFFPNLLLTAVGATLMYRLVMR